MTCPATEDLLSAKELVLHSKTDVEHSPDHLLGGLLITGPVINQMAMIARHPQRTAIGLHHRHKTVYRNAFVLLNVPIDLTRQPIILRERTRTGYRRGGHELRHRFFGRVQLGFRVATMARPATCRANVLSSSTIKARHFPLIADFHPRRSRTGTES